MDSVTQIALGAAVAEATIGRKIGNRAILWGAIAGTLPDLDVFVPLGDVVRDFTYHRSASHSLFVLAILTPLLVSLITRIHADTRVLRNRWLLTIYLVFATHVLLDSLTAYGTQIFWPLPLPPVSLSTIFIIDPFYTLPLLIGVITALVMTRNNDRGHLFNRYALILSSVYLGWTLVAKMIVEHNFKNALRDQDISYQKIFSTPTPFNTLLWRAVVRDEGGYYEAYYSLLDTDNDIRFSYYSSQEELLVGIAEYWPVRQLQWFSRGFYSVSEREGDIVISDLRMGLAPSYAFQFKVGEISNPHSNPSEPEQIPSVWDQKLLLSLWKRIWDSRGYLSSGDVSH